VPAHVAANSGKIARAKPDLQAKITEKLLNIENIYAGKQIDLVKGYIIGAFTVFFEEAEDKGRILEFVKNQLYSDSPRTRKQVEQFLNQWGKEQSE
jgi:hypothetical protein